MTVPLVSAVIPTRNRPDLVVRAVQSALAQTYPAIEVIVVIDGPDALTNSALISIRDARLKMVALEESVGGSEARNVGARRAIGEWVALLDDDDEWMPSKIERQLALAESSTAKFPLLCSQVIARTSTVDLIWPENPPAPPYSEYLLVRSRLSYGEGAMPTSTLVTKRDLLIEVPFQKGLPKHQDWDWILRCVENRDVEVLYSPEPLAIWNVDDGRGRVSRVMAWKASWDWIRSSRQRVTGRAYSSFIASQVARQAAQENAWSYFFPLLRDLIGNGAPSGRDLGMFIGAWLFPSSLHDWLRRLVHSKSASRAATAENPNT